MATLQTDITIVQGQTKAFAATWARNDVPRSLEGYAAHLQIRKRQGSYTAPALVDVSSEDGSNPATVTLEPGGQTGKVLVRIPGGLTAPLKRDAWYDLWVINKDDTSERVRLMFGKVTVSKSATDNAEFVAELIVNNPEDGGTESPVSSQITLSDFYALQSLVTTQGTQLATLQSQLSASDAARAAAAAAQAIVDSGQASKATLDTLIAQVAAAQAAQAATDAGQASAVALATLQSQLTSLIATTGDDVNEEDFQALQNIVAALQETVANLPSNGGGGGGQEVTPMPKISAPVSMPIRTERGAAWNGLDANGQPIPGLAYAELLSWIAGQVEAPTSAQVPLDLTATSGPVDLTVGLYGVEPATGVNGSTFKMVQVANVGIADGAIAVDTPASSLHPLAEQFAVSLGLGSWPGGELDFPVDFSERDGYPGAHVLQFSPSRSTDTSYQIVTYSNDDDTEGVAIFLSMSSGTVMAFLVAPVVAGEPLDMAHLVQGQPTSGGQIKVFCSEEKAGVVADGQVTAIDTGQVFTRARLTIPAESTALGGHGFASFRYSDLGHIQPAELGPEKLAAFAGPGVQLLSSPYISDVVLRAVGRDGTRGAVSDPVRLQSPSGVDMQFGELSTRVSALESGTAYKGGYKIVLMLGQSNSVGQGTPFDQRTDPPHSKVWTFNQSGTYKNKISQAVEPLAHPQAANYLGYGLAFARWYADTLLAGERVLLVPCAVSATPMRASTDTYGTWRRTAPNNGFNLYENAIGYAEAALEAAGPDSEIVAVLWGQGESDAMTGLSSGSIYQDDLLEVIDGLRNRLDDLELPFVVTPFVKAFVDSSALAAEISAVQANVATLRAHTAYVPSPGPGYSSDNLHFDADGNRKIGQALMPAYLAALANTSAPATPAATQPDNPYTGSGNGGSGDGGTDPIVLDGAIVADSFDRPDSTTVGPTEIGGIVAPNQGIATIAGNRLKIVTGGQTMEWPVAPDDYIYQVTCAKSSASDSVAFRSEAGIGFMFWDPQGVVRKFPGTIVAEIGAPYTDGDVLKIKCEGNVFTFWKNGTQVGQVTDTSNPTGNPGFLAQDSGSEWDNMSIAPVTP